MRKILFVCHGNICRSVSAEYILKNKCKDIYCESRAVSNEEAGSDIYEPAKRCLDRHNIKYGKHCARKISQKDYDEFDEIYVMDSSNLRYINRIVDDVDHKIKMLCDYEIEDPWYTDNYDKVFEQICEGVDRIVKNENN